MIWLLRLIPAPWGDVALIGIVFLAWAYGDLTGRGSERQRAEVARLNDTLAAKDRQEQAALQIQTKMAERLADLRVEQQEREKHTDALIEALRAAPAGGACSLSDARRLRLLSIRIGSAGADTRSRQRDQDPMPRSRR